MALLEMTEQEQAYFKSGGESDITEEPAQAPTETTPAAPAEAAPTEQAKSAPEPTEADVAAQADKTEAPREAKDSPEDIQKKLNAALAETRGHNKELRQQLAQLKAQQEESVKRLEEFQKRLTPEQKPPAFEENPAEHLKAEVEQVKRVQTQTLEQQQQAQKAQQFTDWYRNQAAQFAQTQPDFGKAYDAYNAKRSEELQNSGLTREQAAARLIQEEVQLANSAAQSGLNPAQMIYQIAQLKGYKPESTSATMQLEKTQVQQPNKLDNVRRGMEASKPLSSVGGGGQTENLSWEWVASVPDDEFAAAWAKMEKAESLRH